MTQEEKAKAYDEAIKKLHEIITMDNHPVLPKEIGEYLFPELAESDDEKTRKELLEEIESIIPHEDETDSEGLILPSYHTRIDRYKSYLEKQKEYELTEEDKKIIPEALVMLCDDIINHRVHTPIKTDEEGARKIKAFLKTFNRQPHKTMKEWEKQKEQKPAEKQDYSGLNDLERAIHRGFLCAGVENVPVTTINETAKECLKQMKPAEWSEGNKQWLDAIIKDYEDLLSGDEDHDPAIQIKINLLKSLRPNPHWKPSEDQMDALKVTLEYMPDTFKPRCTLMTLQNDLEKLM